MSNPARTGPSSGYNHFEWKSIEDRLETIERLLEINSLDSGTRILGRLLKLENGIHAGTGGPDGQGMTTQALAAAGAVDLTSLITTLDGTTSAFAATLSTPSADGQLKLVKMVASAAHSPTLSGTNIRSSSGASQSGKTAPFTSITAGSVSSIVLISLGGVWVTLASNVSFA